LSAPEAPTVEAGEADLVAKARGGNLFAFEEIVRRHQRRVYATALRILRRHDLADDVVQDTFLRAFKSFDQFNPGTNCRAWLFTIMRNAFLNRVRAAGREVLEPDMDRLEAERISSATAGVASPEETFFQTVLHGDVDRALKELPLPFREAVILADLEGLSYSEMAEILGCPIGTVMSRLSRGRRLLRGALVRFAREHGYVKGADE
jgi:RNA polymerase sigma-70 factor (ECF subfamily)